MANAPRQQETSANIANSTLIARVSFGLQSEYVKSTRKVHSNDRQYNAESVRRRSCWRHGVGGMGNGGIQRSCPNPTSHIAACAFHHSTGLSARLPGAQV